MIVKGSSGLGGHWLIEIIGRTEYDQERLLRKITPRLRTKFTALLLDEAWPRSWTLRTEAQLLRVLLMRAVNGLGSLVLQKRTNWTISTAASISWSSSRITCITRRMVSKVRYRHSRACRGVDLETAHSSSRLGPLWAHPLLVPLNAHLLIPNSSGTSPRPLPWWRVHTKVRVPASKRE